MNKIELINETKINLSLVEKMTNDRLAEYPNYGIYIHAKSQINLIKDIINKKLFTTENLKKIDIGLMAAKDIDYDEPEYAEAIYKLTGSIKKIVYFDNSRPSEKNDTN
jgi:hypothetical protein